MWPSLAGRRIAVTGALAALCWLLAAALPAPALAHAELVASTPADGQRLEKPPSEVVLEFTERVHLLAGAVRLLNAAGRPVTTGTARVDGLRVILPLPPDLPRGGYVVSWRAISSDTHPVAGAFGFGVGADPPRAEAPARQAAPPVRAAVMVGRWASYAGLALLLGGTVFLLTCWPAGRDLRRARGLVTAGWITAVSATVLGLLAQGPFVAGPGASVFAPRLLAQTVMSPFGAVYLSRLVLLIAAGPLVRAVLRARVPSRPTLAATGMLGLGVVVAYAAAGHAVSGRWPGLAVASGAAHVTAMSLWAGGLVLLAACALRPRHVDGLGDAARRFSRLATGSVAVLILTGTFQVTQEIGSFAVLTASGYGRLLLGKLAIVVGLLGLGAMSRYAVRRPVDTVGRLRRTVPLEVGLIAVVLGITSVLALTPPARQAAGSTPRPVQVVLQVPGGGTTHLRVTPAAVGANEVSIVVKDPRGRPWHVPELTATATLPERELGPFDVHLTPDGHGFTGHVTLPASGTWRFDLTIRTTDLDAYVMSTTIRAADGAPR
jgi:copper transport protein